MAITRDVGVPAGTSRRPADRRALQQRIEAHPLGRVAISVLLVFTIGAMIVSNLPASALKTAATPIVRPFLDLTGLHQDWNLFAPDPRRATLRLEARITYADGTTELWHPPSGGALIGVYSTFRWRKWAGNIVSTRNRSLWPEAAAWIARTHMRDGRMPSSVKLVKQSYVASRPGGRNLHQPPWHDTVLYTARFSPEAGS